MTDWNKLKEEMGPKFKPYAGDGVYKVKVADVEFREVGTNGSIAAEFKFEEADTYQFPKATHWLSFKNEGYRKWHFKCLLETLGIATANAEKAIDACESKDSKDAKVKAYEQAFKKAAARHQEVEIEVFTELNQSNGKKYARAEFVNPAVAMPHDSAPAKAQDVLPEADEVLEDGEAIDLDEIPFD